MPEDQFKDILGEELGTEYAAGFDQEKYLNGRTKFEILATQHLAAKRAMAQVMPLLSSIFENQALLANLHQVGKTIDVGELCAMFMETSEFTNRYDLVREMNEKEKEFMVQQAQLAGGMGAQKQMAIDNNKSRNQSDINYEQNDAKAVQIALRHTLEKAIEPEMQGGEAGGGYMATQGG